MSRTSLPSAVGRGLVAGLAGTTLMTAYQLAVRKARGQRLDTPVPRTWADAPPPAQVVKKAAEVVGKPRAVTKKDVPRLVNVVHWSYGTCWGIAYGVAAQRLRPDPLTGAAVLGVSLWGAAYAELAPLGIYEPPWKYPAQELALDLSYHLVYGVGVAAAYDAFDR
jgi:uncharacterized membrane protein YagU involved in acid resistance